MIAILVPSRGRPEQFLRFLDSIQSLSSAFTPIRIYSAHDEDDPVIDDYLTIHTSIANIQLQKNVKTRKPVPQLMEYLGMKAYNDGADFIVIASDDVICTTTDWDLTLVEKYNRYKDKLMVGYFNNGFDRNMAEHYVVSKEWIKVLGYYAPIQFNHFYVDSWIGDIANRAGRLEFFKDIKFRHMHFKYNLAAYDDTYKRTRENDFPRKDKKIFDATEPARVIDAERIKAAICASAL